MYYCNHESMQLCFPCNVELIFSVMLTEHWTVLLEGSQIPRKNERHAKIYDLPNYKLTVMHHK